jgi:hypothetical protein
MENAKIKELMTNTNNLSNETNSISKSILETLEKQEKQLENTENNLDETNFLVDISMRLIKSMTWFGWIYHLFAKIPTRNYTPRNDFDSISTQNNNNTDVNNELTNIEQNIAELYEINKLIGQTLDRQNQTFDRIENKTERVNERTKKATEKTNDLL